MSFVIFEMCIYHLFQVFIIPAAIPIVNRLWLDTSPADNRLYKIIKLAEDRPRAYRGLFKTHIPDKTLKEIREATNRVWVLGRSRFKTYIEEQIG